MTFSQVALPISQIDKSCVTRPKKWFRFLSTFLNSIPIKIGVLVKFSFSSCHFSLKFR